MKHTSKQLKQQIWPKLVLNIQLNKRNQTCDKRGDIKADSVRVGLQGAVPDLNGVDAK